MSNQQYPDSQYSFRADGTPYPNKGNRKPNKKAQRRLDARIANWEAKKVSTGGHQFTKPGSNKK